MKILKKELEDGVDHEELLIPNHSYLLNLFLSWFPSFKNFFLAIALLSMFFVNLHIIKMFIILMFTNLFCILIATLFKKQGT